jgi:S1-C subfamily serine protease
LIIKSIKEPDWISTIYRIKADIIAWDGDYKSEDKIFKNYRSESDLKSYLDSINSLPAEGIWIHSSGNFKVGIVKDHETNDLIGYILESEDPKFVEGQIKFSLEETATRNLYFCDYLTDKFFNIKGLATIEINGGLLKITPTDADDKFEINLLKKYPKIDDSNFDTKVVKESSGTGFCISQDGFIVTAYHVIENAKDIKVKFPGKEWVKAELISKSVPNDIALLKTNINTDDFLKISNKAINLGDKVYTVGYPVTDILGNSAKFNAGTISSTSGIGDEASLIQISVPLQPGNSGGPICNSEGEVIGMATSAAGVEYFYNNTGTLPQNINWAVKSSIIQSIAMDIVNLDTKIYRKDISEVEKATCFIEVNL